MQIQAWGILPTQLTQRQSYPRRTGYRPWFGAADPSPEALSQTLLAGLKALPVDEKAAFLIGRDPKCRFAFPSLTILSAEHGAFQKRPDGLYYADLGSTNGSYVNEQRLSTAVKGKPPLWHKLNPGDTLTIALLNITLGDDLSSPPAARPAATQPRHVEGITGPHRLTEDPRAIGTFLALFCNIPSPDPTQRFDLYASPTQLLVLRNRQGDILPTELAGCQLVGSLSEWNPEERCWLFHMAAAAATCKMPGIKRLLPNDPTQLPSGTTLTVVCGEKPWKIPF